MSLEIKVLVNYVMIWFSYPVKLIKKKPFELMARSSKVSFRQNIVSSLSKTA